MTGDWIKQNESSPSFGNPPYDSPTLAKMSKNLREVFRDRHTHAVSVSKGVCVVSIQRGAVGEWAGTRRKGKACIQMHTAIVGRLSYRARTTIASCVG